MIGNETCKKCGKSCWRDFEFCQFCCTHDYLSFGKEQDDQGFFYITAYCDQCGSERGDDKNDMVRNYRIIRNGVAE